MTSSGFRLFEVDLHKRMTMTNLPWVTDVADAFDTMVSLVARLTDQHVDEDQTYHDIAQWGGSAFPTLATSSGRHVARFRKTQTNLRTLQMTFTHGRFGSYPTAVSATREVSLSNYAPSRTFKASLMIPSVPDAKGLLVVEAQGRTCPKMAACKALSLSSRILSGEDQWLRLNLTQMVDAQFLNDILEKSQKAEISLKRVTRTSDGKRIRQEYTFHAPLVRSSWKDMLTAKFRAKAPANSLLELVGISDGGDISFTDANLTLDDQTIVWGRTEELFTYPIKDRAEWDDEVSEVVGRLRPDLI